MMKQFFRYGSGYINIDDENLYFTKTGNWQEAGELEEKNDTTIAENNRRMNKITISLCGLFLVLTATLFFIIDNAGISIVLIGAFGFILYNLFFYFKSSLKKRYKIPLSKIEFVSQQDNNLTVHFRRQNDEMDSENINNIDGPGIDFLKRLSLPFSSTDKNVKYLFKYCPGYINLDQENLYLTKSGNWNETRRLKEKKKHTAKISTRLAWYMRQFFNGLGLVFILYVIFYDPQWNILLPIFIVYTLIYLSVFYIAKVEYNAKYKIPVSKILSVEKVKKGIKITYRLKQKGINTIILSNVENKGIKVLTSLGLQQS